MSISGAADAPVNITPKISCQNAGGSLADSYSWITNDGAVPEDTWVELTGDLNVTPCASGQTLQEVLIYFEVAPPPNRGRDWPDPDLFARDWDPMSAHAGLSSPWTAAQGSWAALELI